MEVMNNGTTTAWRERIAAQQASGQTIRAWCRQNGCAEHAFYWWRSKLGLSPGRQRPARPLAFAEVVVNQPRAEPLRLRLTGERELIFPASMPLEQMAKLIRALEVTA